MTTGVTQRTVRHSLRVRWWLLCCCGVIILLVLALAWQTVADPDQDAPPSGSDPVEVARGEYLALIGNCSGCHTIPGGARMAGGRGIPTPFGAVYASNISPDPATGIGAWSSQAFWRAMHHGRSRDGRLLYPAFPYPNFSRLTRSDSNALLAYLRSLPAVRQANRPHELRFPYNTGLALAAWRLLFFRVPDTATDAPQTVAGTPRSAQWQRGAYLVNGLGHCSACHATRNSLGGSFDPLQVDGGLLPGERWLAPSLLAVDQAGVGDWSVSQIVELLVSGVSERGSVQGPMAEVVFGSTRHLTAADAAAMAVYLKSLGSGHRGTIQTFAASAPSETPDAQTIGSRKRGATLYADHCANCHGSQGEGRAGAYPALAGNRGLLLDPPVNLLQTIIHGGFAPTTAGNPRPFGMPPFGLQLSQSEIADLMTYLRSAWGHSASEVGQRDVQRWMERP